MLPSAATDHQYFTVLFGLVVYGLAPMRAEILAKPTAYAAASVLGTGAIADVPKTRQMRLWASKIAAGSGK